MEDGNVVAQSRDSDISQVLKYGNQVW